MKLSTATFLQAELKFLQEKNKSFSKRAFAKKIGFSFTYTLYLLKGERTLTEEKAIEVASLLQMDQNKKDLFLLICRLDRTTEPSMRYKLEDEISLKLFQKNNIKEVDDSILHLSLRWYLGAVMILLQRHDGQFAVKKIAEALGITQDDVSDCIERLLAEGVVQKTESGSYIITNKNINVEGTPSTHIRQYHRSNIQLSNQFLQAKGVELRNYTGLTLAFNDKNIKEFELMLNEFRSQLIMKFANNRENNAIYQLNTQFFPLYIDGIYEAGQFVE